MGKYSTLHLYRQPYRHFCHAELANERPLLHQFMDRMNLSLVASRIVAEENEELML